MGERSSETNAWILGQLNLDF